MKNTISSYAILVLILCSIHLSSAQKIKWLRVGDLQSFISETGAEYEGINTSGNRDFFSWPAQYGHVASIGDQTNSRAKGLWIGCKNFDDPVEQKIKSFKVVGSGPRDFSDRVNQIFTQEIKLIGKFPRPSVVVDDTRSDELTTYDNPDSIDENLPCDRMVIVRFNTSIGISVTKKVMAFSSSEHGNYFINDYVFKNTGIVDGDGTVYSQTLDSVWFYFVYRNAFAGVTSDGFGSTWGAFESIWGNSTVNHDFGDYRLEPNNPDMRGFYSYYGPSNSSVRPPYAEDWGCPNLNENGVLGSAKYNGCVTLHADKSSSDSSDDLTQPKTTAFIGSDINIMNANVSQYDETFMADKYTAMSEGHLDKPHDETVGFGNYPILYNDPRRQSGGGTSQGQGYGPYTLAPGDSIHIVFAEGVSGLSWEMCREIGSHWFQWRNTGSGPTLTMPNGSTTTDYNGYKNAWIFTGKDSIIKTFQNARKNFQSNYNIPQPPPPPNEFVVDPDGNSIMLRWTDNAYSYPHFDGYVIYRSDSTVLDWTTSYKKIFECNKSNVVHSFDDTTAKWGVNYYYYIQSKDDGSTNDIHTGVPLYSSKFYTITTIPASLKSIPVGYYRTHQSGNWNDINSWERYNGSDWEFPVSHVAKESDGAIKIQSGHTITVASSETIDQLTIVMGGTLVIEKDVVLHVKNGDSTDLFAYGSVKNYGMITKDDSATIVIINYFHEQDGGSIPKATIYMCYIDSVVNTVPLNINQNYYEVIWNCPNQSGEINLGWSRNTITNITVKNTGIGSLQMCSPATDSTVTIVMYGDVNLSGGHLTANGTNNPDTKVNIVQQGTINVNGGSFSLCKGTQGGTGTTTWYFNGGSFSNTTIQNSNPARAKFVLANSGVLDFGAGNTISAFPLEVKSGATLSLNNGPLMGSGDFILDSGATLEVTHAGGIDSTIKTTGSKKFNSNSSYIFGGKSLQVTGSMLPDTIDNLTIKNEDRVMLSKSVVANNIVEMRKGVLSLGGNTLSYGTHGTLKYSGTTVQTTTNAEFPLLKGPKNVAITTFQGVTLHATRIIRGHLMSNSKIILGNNNLTVDSIFASTVPNTFSSEKYVVTNGVGALWLTSVGAWQKLFPVGTQTDYAPVWITNKGAIDTIGVSVVDDKSKSIGGGRLKVKWYIRRNNNETRNDSIRFGWVNTLEDSVFNTNLIIYSKIFRLSDTTEAGIGAYRRSSVGLPLGYAVSRGGITIPDSFVVGYFTGLTGGEEMIAEIPTVFSLKQNYPNPFNPSTTIAFGIPSKSFVSLKIYDVIGREVATIVSEELAAGNYKKQWNGQGLASGVYFYRIHAGSFVDTKKLVLLK